MKILGRKSEMINVGGLKVFPAEVESVLLTMDGVEDVAINAEKSELTGNIVKARVKLSTGESVADFRKRMRQFCKGKLETFKVPQKVVLVDEMMTGARFKKMRKECIMMIDEETIYVNLEGSYWAVKTAEKEMTKKKFDLNNKWKVREELIASCDRYAPCTICAYKTDRISELYRCGKNDKPEFIRTSPDFIINV